jgi:hypothetical protein
VTSQPPITAVTTPPISSVGTQAPVQVVEQYWNDMNVGDFQSAWSLGGSNLQSSAGSESNFAAINAVAVGTTSAIVSYVNSSQAYVQLRSGGLSFIGTYTVSNGVITSASVQRTS